MSGALVFVARENCVTGSHGRVAIRETFLYKLATPPTPEDCRNDGLKFTSSLSVKEASLLVLEHWPEM